MNQFGKGMKLFNYPHPVKNITKNNSSCIYNNDILNLDLKEILFFKILKVHKSNTVDCIVSTNNNIYCFSICFQEQKSQIFGSFKCSDVFTKSKKYLFSTLSNILVVSSNNYIEVINPVRQNKNKLFHQGLFKIKCICSSYPYLIACKSDTSINVFRIDLNNSTLFSILTYQKLRCCALSLSFDIVVVGGKGRELFLISLSQKVITNVVKIKGTRANKVIVTSSWGFIIVYETEIREKQEFYLIEVFTINGSLINCIEVPFQVENWFTWSSFDDFDYLVLATKDNQIFSCEVFYLNFHLITSIHNEDIIGIEYDPTLKIIIIPTKSCKIIMLPYVFE